MDYMKTMIAMGAGAFLVLIGMTAGCILSSTGKSKETVVKTQILHPEDSSSILFPEKKDKSRW